MLKQLQRAHFGETCSKTAHTTRHHKTSSRGSHHTCCMPTEAQASATLPLTGLAKVSSSLQRTAVRTHAKHVQTAIIDMISSSACPIQACVHNSVPSPCLQTQSDASICAAMPRWGAPQILVKKKQGLTSRALCNGRCECRAVSLRIL